MQLEATMMKGLLFLFCLEHSAMGVMSSETGSTFQDLLKKMENMELLLANQIKVNHGLQRQLDEQAETIERMESENEKNQNSYVSFTASASQTREYSNGDHVLFDSVLRNYGGSYFAGNSTFICPFSAYYLFSISVRADYAQYMHARIQLDDSALVSVRATDDTDSGTTSNQAVTYCGAGQSVWVLCLSGDENVMDDNTGRHSTFSGTLLRLA